MSPTVLVIRATGSVGRAVCKHSLQQDFKVRALVRDSKEDRAVALQELGVSLYEGSIDDRSVLDEALEGCDQLLLNLMPRLDEEGSELRQAQFIIDAAKAAGVRQIVYCSVIIGHVPDDLLDSPIYKTSMTAKKRVEELVQNSGFERWTIFRPGYFMTNFFFPIGGFMFPELAPEHKFVTSLQPETVLPLVDPNDIGAFCTTAFAKPEKFGGHIVTIASDKQAVTDVLKMLEKASGKTFEPTYRSYEESRELAKTNPVITGQLMTLHLAKEVDMENVASWGVKLTTFDAFLQRERDLVKETFDSSNRKALSLQEALNKPS